jgi:hypothetical protein
MDVPIYSFSRPWSSEEEDDYNDGTERNEAVRGVTRSEMSVRCTRAFRSGSGFTRVYPKVSELAA